MKSFFLIAFTTLISLPAMAQCKWFARDYTLLYQGYTINYEQALVEAMDGKGYERVLNSAEADWEFSLNAEPEDRRFFQYATVTANFVAADGRNIWTASDDKRCLTQLCGILDFRNPIVKVLKQLDRKLPGCQ